MSGRKPRFQQRPKKEEQEKDLDQFAQQAGHAPEGEEPTAWPWDEVNTKEKKAVPLYLPRDVYEKLKFLSENTDVPQQRIMRNAVVPEVERQLNELLKKMGE